MGENMRKIKTQSGRSMVEMMGYMAVVMVLMASIGRIVANAYGEYKLSKASVQLTELSSAIIKASAIDLDYSEVVSMINGTHSSDVKNAEGLKMIPSSFRTSSKTSGNDKGNKIYNAFGKPVSVGVTPDNDKKLSISYVGLTRDQCIALAMKDWINNKVADLYSITINDNVWVWPIYFIDDSTGVNVLPVKRSVVAGVDNDGQCNKATGNTIMWVFN